VVQIKNRTTGLYDKKGCYHDWSKKGGAWGSMSQAKAHVRLMDGSMDKVKEYLDSDFIELTEDNQVVVTPVSDYLIPKIEEKVTKLKNSCWEDNKKDVVRWEKLLKENS
jgi:type IV secretory pathway VirB4 component